MADDRIDIDAESIELSRTDGAVVEVKSGARGSPIKAHPRFSINGSPYASYDEAKNAAFFFRERLLAWVTRRRFAMDFGDGLIRSWLTPAGVAEAERQIGHPVRMDAHGVDVFEKQEDQRIAFVHFDVGSKLSVNGEEFISGLRASLSDPTPFSIKESLAAELYAASRCDPSFRSRFLTLMCGIEALLEPAKRAAAVGTLMDEFQRRAREAEGIDSDTRQSLRSALDRLRSESIGQAGRRLARSLGSKQYLSLQPDEFLRYVYGVRSQLVHRGRPEETDLDLLKLANVTSEFLGDLLEQAVVRRTGRSTERPTVIQSVAGYVLPGTTGAVVPSTAYVPPRKP